MGRVAAMCVGLLAGAAIGWFARGAFPAARTEPLAAPTSAGAAGTAPEPGLAAGSGLPPAPARAEDSPVPSVEVGRDRTVRPPRSVDDLRADLREAAAAGDTRKFKQAVRALGQANDASGDAALVAVMADVSTSLPVVGKELDEALLDSKAPGIAEAARRRLESALERRESSWTEYAGWVDLVARHGSAADLEWLGASSAGRFDHWAVPALGRSGRAEAAGILRRRMAAGDDRATTEAIGELAKSRPDDAWALALLRPSREVLSGYVANAPAEALARVEDHLRALPDDESRIEAVYVVSALANRKRDVSGLAVVVEAPVRFLARIAAGEAVTERTRPLLNQAGYAIEYNRLTWSEHAARTLEAADVALDAAAISVGGPEFPHVAALVREGLKKRWD